MDQRDFWAPPPVSSGQSRHQQELIGWPTPKHRLHWRIAAAFAIGIGVLCAVALASLIVVMVYSLAGPYDCESPEAKAQLRAYQSHTLLMETPPAAVLLERSYYCIGGLAVPFARYESAAPDHVVRERYKTLALQDGWTLHYDKGASEAGGEPLDCGSGAPKASDCNEQIVFTKAVDDGSGEIWLTVDSYVDDYGSKGFVVAIVAWGPLV